MSSIIIAASDPALPSQRPTPRLVTKVAGIDPAKVVRSFATWAYKREQPSDPALLLATVKRATDRGVPLSFVLYWGKGPRTRTAQPDRQCLDYLASLAARVREVYAPGVLFDLVFTDTHARLNGHQPPAIEQYFRGIEALAAPGPFRFHRLSALVATIDAGDVEIGDPDPATLHQLEQSAAKWYRGEGDVRHGAREYFRLNMIERLAIERAFPEAIFTTFNGSDCRALFPERMPIFYMYSLRKGFAVKPWFLPDPDAPPAAAMSVMPATV